MIGSLRKHWEYTREEIWEPLAAHEKSPIDLFIALYDVAEEFLSLPTSEVLYEEMALLLEDFTLFDIGLQSICPEALRHLRRGFNRTRFLRGVELLKKLNRHTNLYLILGLPGETFFSFLLGVQFCVDRNVSRLFINHLCVLNGTALREDAVALKLHYKCTPPYTAQSSYSFSAGEMDLARVFADTIVREHDALALAPHGILLEQ